MRFDHCAFQVTDIEKAIAFYTKILGFKFLSVNTSEQHTIKYAFLEINGAKIELLEDLKGSFTKPQISEPFCPHICIEVEDMTEAVNQLKANGVEIISGPSSCEAGEILVYFGDQDNNVIEYIQWLDKK